MNETQMTLAVDWVGQWSLVGWFASEKIFDCRAMWDGADFWTRSGRIVPAPKWFKRGLPKVQIDGGIYAGRTGFQTASNAVRLGGRWFDNRDLEFVAFDFPGMAATWDRRIAEAAKALKKSACARAIDFERIADPLHLVRFMRRIRAAGGEGGCFRHPDAIGYEQGRTENLLRWKFTDN
jgi:hypothetical protein